MPYHYPGNFAATRRQLRILLAFLLYSFVYVVVAWQIMFLTGPFYRNLFLIMSAVFLIGMGYFVYLRIFFLIKTSGHPPMDDLLRALRRKDGDAIDRYFRETCEFFREHYPNVDFEDRFLEIETAIRRDPDLGRRVISKHYEHLQRYFKHWKVRNYLDEQEKSVRTSAHDRATQAAVVPRPNPTDETARQIMTEIFSRNRKPVMIGVLLVVLEVFWMLILNSLVPEWVWWNSLTFLLLHVFLISTVGCFSWALIRAYRILGKEFANLEFREYAAIIIFLIALVLIPVFMFLIFRVSLLFDCDLVGPCIIDHLFF